MHLVYLDETGNTGADLNDVQQPVFVLAALIVPEVCWQDLEKDLETGLAALFPTMAAEGREVHGKDLRNGSEDFKGVASAQRLQLRDDWLKTAQKHQLKLVYRAIVKKRFQRWSHDTFGSGVSINPHVAAFPLVARVVDEYLDSLPGKALGMFISDENKEIVHDVEKSIKILRGAAGALRLARIVEKGFFIDSTKSRVLQLCDVCAFSARKKEEAKAGKPIKGPDEQGVALIEPLIHCGNEALVDVLAWLTTQQSQAANKKERPGTKS